MNNLDKNIIGKYLDVKNYPDLASTVPDRKIEISEIIEPYRILEVTAKYKPYLCGVQAFAAAVTSADEMIFIGSGRNDAGVIYYVDIEFGVFKLHDSIQEFIKVLKT